MIAYLPQGPRVFVFANVQSKISFKLNIYDGYTIDFLTLLGKPEKHFFKVKDKIN